MNNLKNFVLECFEELITDFGFEIDSDDVSSYYVSLSNKKCIIRFGLDMGYLVCMFVDPVLKNGRSKIKRADGLPAPDPVYMMHSVWMFLYPDDSEVSGYNDSDLYVQASAIKKILLGRFKHVLNGDFSWTSDFEHNNDRVSKKIEYMSKYLQKDHPVRSKFDEGDPNWEKYFDDLNLPAV